MHRFLVSLFAILLLLSPAWAQEAQTDTESDETDATQVETENVDDSDLDDQGFSDEDNDFRPSEDIPADQSIPFPTDI